MCNRGCVGIVSNGRTLDDVSHMCTQCDPNSNVNTSNRCKRVRYASHMYALDAQGYTLWCKALIWISQTQSPANVCMLCARMIWGCPKKSASCTKNCVFPHFAGLSWSLLFFLLAYVRHMSGMCLARVWYVYGMCLACVLCLSGHCQHNTWSDLRRQVFIIRPSLTFRNKWRFWKFSCFASSAQIRIVFEVTLKSLQSENC